jgi:hypothetical protein
VIGHDRAGWIDVLGLVLVLATTLAVLVHAALRIGRCCRSPEAS